MDRKYGAVVVLGEEHLAEDAFNIGNQIAAAGANLHAAVKETKKVENLDFRTQYELVTKCLTMRWADDSLQVWDRRISGRTRQVLKDLRSEGFYGGNLKQIPSGAEENTAFGFRLRTTSGLVKAQAAKTFANEKGPVGVEETEWPHVHGGSQYSSMKTKVTTVQGRIVRELGLTNGTEKEAEQNVMRTVFEFNAAGYPRKVLTKAVQKSEQVSWVRFTKMLEMLRRCSDEELKAWCTAWDEEQRLAQWSERLVLAAEARSK